MSVLNAFKMKTFDLEPVLLSWAGAPDCPPRFTGNIKKEIPVKDWLEAIRTACVAKKVPEEYWPKVAQHYMAGVALYRIKEVKKVMRQLHGGAFRWTWTKFKVAMESMEWDEKSNEAAPGFFSSLLGTKKTEEPSQAVTVAAKAPERPSPVKAKTADASFWPLRKNSVAESVKSESVKSDTTPSRPTPKKAATTDSSFWLRSSKEKTPAVSALAEVNAVAVKTKDEALVEIPKDAPKPPKWLVDAAGALSFLKGEHPQVMSLAAAILIGIGSIPAMPGMAAGAGGAVLASGTVQAVGAIAVGIGSMIQAVQSLPTGKAEGQSNGH